MKSLLLNVSKDSKFGLKDLEAHISIQPLVTFIKRKIANSSSINKAYFESLLVKLEKDTDLQENIPIDKTHEHESIFKEIYNFLVPPASDESDVKLAFSSPLRATPFYGTDSFYNLLLKKESQCLDYEALEEYEPSSKKDIIQVYSLILEKLYGFPQKPTQPAIICIKAPDSTLKKYYKLDVDNTFVKISPKGKLPDFDILELRESWQKDFDVSSILRILPLSQFKFEGFSVIKLEDVTVPQSVEHIKSLIIDRASFENNSYHEEILNSLKNLTGNANLCFDLVPLLKVNDDIVLNPDTLCNSQLFRHTFNGDTAQNIYINFCKEYFKNPCMIFKPSLDTACGGNEFDLKVLKSEFKSMAIIPVLCKKNVVGLLIVYSKEKNAINEMVMGRLHSAISIIAQSLEHDIAEFNQKIETIIREKYTFLQGAVEWKFKEAALHYMEERLNDSLIKNVETIAFKDVYPLYGAIDVRNSTIERNNAQHLDFTFQISALLNTLNYIQKHVKHGLTDKLIARSEKFLDRIVKNEYAGDELKIQAFLDIDINTFISEVKSELTHTATGEMIDKYLSLSEESGTGHLHRRGFENDMQTINSTVNRYLENSKGKLQEDFPTYFEKFRTDGVEYDIYIGQSIEPKKTFKKEYLDKIRKWQLSSMAEIAILNEALLPKLSLPLRTTQLIFINPGSIDISFREDERRFDVEGSYNIRYEVIKKRIDKVKLKGKDERLTQPGKIALVYFDSQTALEYIPYIEDLQAQGLLLDDLELLELEHLQGVNGLKALRVGINLNSETNIVQ
ncbi:GAF domain-containing protein [Arcticibacterium luteifluviistationis]|uniref:GAF domain-containing protein n=1 Tax=Arcticibacterium luteifluviistationis TaxID=1784714 RepID=A0A2Z4GH08_9BACT|nr:GAF domain-containing protein [Arcticibacterium luteifluviistationis]AWW00209.1 GAF domain-containing protein [Arcticibacterium luteifluviistationis]